MCLAQGPQRSDAGEARTNGPSVLSQALFHWATALPKYYLDKGFSNTYSKQTNSPWLDCSLICAGTILFAQAFPFWAIWQ